MCLVLRLGQHDDARMCIAIALTAARLGASIANHCEVMELIKHKEESGKETLSGARVKDRLTGRTRSGSSTSSSVCLIAFPCTSEVFQCYL